jgi:beta-phosphoglucomutase
MIVSTKKAFLFDMNGTMIDDMDYHIIAWHRILNELDAGISLERMKAECYGKNDELLERMLPGRFTTEEKQRMSVEKERKYQKEYRPRLALLPGLQGFLDRAKAKHIPMAIGTAAIMLNVDFTLDGLNIRSYFDVIVSADDIIASKPDPETYLKCAAALKLDTAGCIVFEDSPKGVESAARAGMKAVVITTMHTAEEFAAYDNVIMIIADYHDSRLNELL